MIWGRLRLSYSAAVRAVLSGLEGAAPMVFPNPPKNLTDLFILYAEKAKLNDVTFHCLCDTCIS